MMMLINFIDAVGLDLLVPIGLVLAGLLSLVIVNLWMVLALVMLVFAVYVCIPKNSVSYTMSKVSQRAARMTSENSEKMTPYWIPSMLVIFAFGRGVATFFMANSFRMLLKLAARTNMSIVAYAILLAYFAEVWFPSVLPRGFVNAVKWLIILLLVMLGNLRENEHLELFPPLCFYFATLWWQFKASDGCVKSCLTRLLAITIPQKSDEIMEIAHKYYDQLSLTNIRQSAWSTIMSAKEIMRDLKKAVEELREKIDVSEGTKALVKLVGDSSLGPNMTIFVGFLLASPSLIAATILIIVGAEMRVSLVLAFLPLMAKELQNFAIIHASTETSASWRYLANCEGTPAIIAAVRTLEGILAIAAQGSRIGGVGSSNIDNIEYIRLAACIAVDICGSASFFFPPLELLDVFFAPIAAFVTWLSVGGTWAPALVGIKELLIFTDIIPVSTISFIMQNPHIVGEMYLKGIKFD